MSPTPPWLLVLCHEFPPLGGGCGRNLRILCRELASRGLRLEVWTMASPASDKPAESFPVRYFATGRQAIFETSVLRLIRYGFVVRKARREAVPPPAAILSAMGFPAGWAGVRLGEQWRIPHFVWYHGTDVHGGRPEGPGFLGKWYLRWLFRHSQGSFFVSRDLQALAEKAGIPPVPRMLPSCPAPEIRNAQAAPAGAPAYFLWAGRLEPVKNPMLLIAALRRFRSQGGKISLRMHGEGRLAEAVEQGLHAVDAEGLCLEPPLSSQRMPPVLAGALAVLLTSRVEGFSTLLLEAACLGVPAVACDAPGVREFLRDEVNGLLVPPGDPEALAAAMLRMQTEPGLRNRLGAAARRDAEAFTPERNAASVLRAFREQGLDWVPENMLAGA